MTDNPILWVLLAIGAILLFVLLLAGITSLLTAFFRQAVCAPAGQNVLRPHVRPSSG